MTTLDRARRYLATLPRAISGSGGHAATYAAAVAAVKGFALPEHIALDELRGWNTTHADPPWSDADLRHKVRSAAQSDKPSGYLLNGADTAPRSTSLSDDQIQKKADQRRSWPTFRPLSDETMVELATLRRLPLEAVHIAHNAGLLRGAQYEENRCFVISEGDFAQARRLDGGKLPVPGEESKAKNLRGSTGAFIGRTLLGGQGATGPAGPVLLVEGCVGLLEGIAAALSVDADAAGWTVLAATSSSSRFDSAWLERLQGRRVRILADPDKAGIEAAGIWTTSLRTVGCVVDGFRLPAGHHDLGDLLPDLHAHRVTLKRLFTL